MELFAVRACQASEPLQLSCTKGLFRAFHLSRIARTWRRWLMSRPANNSTTRHTFPSRAHYGYRSSPIAASTASSASEKCPRQADSKLLNRGGRILRTVVEGRGPGIQIDRRRLSRRLSFEQTDLRIPSPGAAQAITRH